MLYSHRDYKTPFDRGTIFDLTTKQPVNVDRKIRFDEPFNITDGQSDLAQLNAEYHLNSQWTARFDYSYSQDKYSDNQARVTAYDATTGTLTRRVDATQGSTQRMHATRADLQGNVDIAGFYNEILGGVSYEYYDLLRTDMIRCKKAKDFNIYNPVYGNTSKCTTVSASDGDQTIKQESYSAYAQDALYLTDNWIAVAGIRYQYYTQYAGKGRPFNVNTDSRDEQWTPKLGLVYKLTPSVSYLPIIRKHLCRSRQLPATLAIFHRNHLMLTKSGQNSSYSMVSPQILRCLIYINVTCCIPKVLVMKPLPKRQAVFVQEGRSRPCGSIN